MTTRPHVRRYVVLAAAVYAFIVTPAVASTGPSQFTFYRLPTTAAGPCVTTVTGDGTAWFLEFRAGQIGAVNPTSGRVDEYPIPGSVNPGLGGRAPDANSSALVTPTMAPCAITEGADGNIYFTNGVANQIGSINPRTLRITLYHAPDARGNLFPFDDIAAGPDYAIWFTQTTGNAVGRFDLATHTFSSYPVPMIASTPLGIFAGSDGGIWFAEGTGNKIGRLDIKSKRITEYAMPTPVPGPLVLRAETEGRYLWFTEGTANKIGRIEMITAAIAEARLPPGTAPVGICKGSDGSLYYNGMARNVIGKVQPSTLVVTEISVPLPLSIPTELNCGPDKTVWIMLNGTNSVGRYVIP